jgi:hypothetical protein
VLDFPNTEHLNEALERKKRSRLGFKETGKKAGKEAGKEELDRSTGELYQSTGKRRFEEEGESGEGAERPESGGAVSKGAVLNQRQDTAISKTSSRLNQREISREISEFL